MLVSPEEVRSTLTALLPPHLRDAPTVPAYSRRIDVAGTTISRALARGIDRRHLDRWVRRASAIVPEPPPAPASRSGLVLTAAELGSASLAVLARRHGVGIAVIRGLRKRAGIQTTRGRKSIPGYEISPRAPGPAPKALARAVKSYDRRFDALVRAETRVEKARKALAQAEAVVVRRRERMAAAGDRVKELEGRRS